MFLKIILSPLTFLFTLFHVTLLVLSKLEVFKVKNILKYEATIAFFINIMTQIFIYLL